MSKRIPRITIRLTEAEQSALLADAGGRDVSKLARERIFARQTERGGNAPPGGVAHPVPSSAAPTIKVFHVDELGPDPWYRDTGALKK